MVTIFPLANGLRLQIRCSDRATVADRHAPDKRRAFRAAPARCGASRSVQPDRGRRERAVRALADGCPNERAPRRRESWETATLLVGKAMQGRCPAVVRPDRRCVRTVDATTLRAWLHLEGSTLPTDCCSESIAVDNVGVASISAPIGEWFEVSATPIAGTPPKARYVSITVRIPDAQWSGAIFFDDIEFH